MSKRTKLLSLSLAGMAILLLGTTAASANRFSIDDSTFRTVFNPMEFDPDAGETLRCPVTLAGSFHSRTIAKTSGALIGHITSAAVGTCEGGSATILTGTLPWHMTYESFQGTLPNITVIYHRIVGMSGQVNSSGVVCLFRTTTEEPMRAGLDIVLVPRFRLLLTPDPSTQIDIGSGFLCDLAGDFSMRSEGVITDGSGGSIAVSLI